MSSKKFPLCWFKNGVKWCHEGEYLHQPSNRKMSELGVSDVQATNNSELHQHAQKYNAQLQEYNSKLQADLQSSSHELKRLTVSYLCPTHLDALPRKSTF